MKYILFTLLLPTMANAQFRKENGKNFYRASNGIEYVEGGKIELGRGAGLQGTYKYIHQSGWAGSTEPITGMFAGEKGIIKDIRVVKNKRRDFEKVWMLVGLGNITPYSIEVEQAISECEVVPCKNPAATSVNSIADEIIKLNELKEKGIITDEEFKKQKEKLLNQ